MTGPTNAPADLGSTRDPYRTWDAAYVLGALSPSERLEFQAHLTECEQCRASVAELAPLPGMLASVPRDVAEQMLDGDQLSTAPPAGDTLTTLARRTARTRWRNRMLAIGGAVVAAAAAVLITLPLAHSNESTPPTPAGPQVVAARSLDELVQTPLSASVKLMTQPGGGTRVDFRCSYDKSGSAGSYSGKYAMYVTTQSGVQSKIAEWTANPGDTITGSAVSAVAPHDITRVDIRSESTDEVLLSATI
ncbi:zf-HC2 domain-containing protein [Skermania sp. ID1734]|uniref:anti-sigma factor family protein n=1 Tax=Skermania sp. ID1734 TaxID=2597516 RepID=UPI00118062D8|nr:zf-HC2 domain-containing protein [Skermania sp. ID1734]TSD99276.1 zf-HC2 domain-containing protein [Skermania sp. ID1734]